MMAVLDISGGREGEGRGEERKEEREGGREKGRGGPKKFSEAQ